jgi:hypothetical protein
MSSLAPIELRTANSTNLYSTLANVGDSVIRTTKSNKLIIQTGTTNPGIIIDISNNIGINKIPAYNFDVSGNVNISKNVIIGNNANIGGVVNIAKNLAVNNNTFYVDTSNNLVGINTSNPSYALDIVGDIRVSGHMSITGTTTTVNTNTQVTEQLVITNAGTGPAIIANQIGTNPIVDFQDDGISVFKIINGGNVGIGTITPNYKLQVIGSTGISGDTVIGGNFDVSGNANIIGSVLGNSFTGIGTGLTQLNSSNINQGTLLVNYGGTGSQSLRQYSILVGNGTNTVIQPNNLTYNSNILAAPYFSGDGSALSNINSSNISFGTATVAIGGTGLTTLTANTVLVGNGTGAIINNPNLYWDNTNNRLGIGKNPTSTLDINGAVYSVNGNQNSPSYSFASYTGTGIFAPSINILGFTTNGTEAARIDSIGNFGIGKSPSTKLDINGTTTSTLFSGSGASLANLNSSNINTGTLLVNYGGTGSQNLALNQLLVGNTTGTVIQSANLTWASNILTATQFSGSGTTLTTLNSSNITQGTLLVNYGGTGVQNLPVNQIIVGNGTSPVLQSSNLTWSSNILTATQFSGSGTTLTTLNSSNITQGTLLVNYGGTGAQTLSANKLLVGNGTGTLIQPSNLHWDNTNIRLGINTSSPNYTLDVNGTINTPAINMTGPITTNNNTINVGYGLINAGSITHYSIASKNIGVTNNTIIDNGTSALTPTYLNASTITTNYGVINGTSVYYLLFSGNSYLNNTSSNFNFNWITSPITIEAWVISNSFQVGNQSAPSLIGYSNLGSLAGPSNHGWAFGINSTGKVVFSYSNGTTSPITVISTGTVTINTWTHIALSTTSGGVIKIFINGILDTTTTVNGTPSLNGSLLVGGIQGSYLNAGVYNLRLEKNTLYTTNFTPSLTISATANTLLLLQTTGSGYSQVGFDANTFTSGTATANLFSGSAALLINLNSSNINTGTLLVNYGGTGVQNLPVNQIIVGNGVNSVIQSPNLTWNGTILAATQFTGSGTTLTTLNSSNVTQGTLLVNYGGTGMQSLASNQIIIGNGTNPVLQSSNLTWSANVLYATQFSGSGTTLTTLNSSNVTQGTLLVNYGGTGMQTLPINQVIVGNGTGPVIQSSNLTWNSNILTATQFSGSGTTLTTLNSSNVTQGTLLVNYGGTGVQTLPINQVIVGNGTGPVIQSSNLTWNSNILTATQFSGSGTTLTTLNSSNVTQGTLLVNYGGTGVQTLPINQVIVGNGTGPVIQSSNLTWASNILTATQFSGSGTTLTTLNSSNITQGTLLVNYGGTGLQTLPTNQLLIGNGTGAIITNSGLSFSSSTLTTPTLTATGLITGQAGLTLTTGQTLTTSSIYGTATTPTTIYSPNGQTTFQSANENSGIIAIIPFSNTGTTGSFVPSQNVGLGLFSNTSKTSASAGDAWTINLRAGSNNLWIKTSGNNPSIVCDLNQKVGINNLTVPLNSLDVSGNMAVGSFAGLYTAPLNSLIVAGKIGIANPSPNYTLDVSGNINFTGTMYLNGVEYGKNATSINVGTLSVTYGGSGLSNPTATQILVGNGSNSLLQSSNLTWSSNILSATQFSGSGTTLTTLNSSNITQGTLSVNYGGTGVQTLPINQLLVGNGTNPVLQSANLTWASNILTATQFSGSGTTLTTLNSSNITQGTLLVNYGGTGLQTLTANAVLVGNGTGALINNANLYWDNTNIRLGIGKTPTTALDVNGTTTSTLFSGSGALLSALNSTNINTGTLLVNYGGTGLQTLTANAVLVGNGTGAVINSNIIYTNSQLGIGKTPSYPLDVSGNVNITGTFIGAGSTITSINASNINSGTHSVTTGGTGLQTLTANAVLVGNGTGALINNSSLYWDNTNIRLGVGKTPGTALDINGTATSTLFSGSGASLSNLNSTNINTGTLLVNYGGTGLQSLTANAVLVGNGTGAVINNANLYWDNTNIRLGIGKIPTNTIDVSGNINITGSFIGAGSSITSINASNVNSGTLIVANGGTGLQNLTANAILVGNGTNSIINNINLYWDNINVRLGVGKTPSYPLDVSGNINITGSYIGSGTTLTTLNSSNITQGTLLVNYGGTGAQTLTANAVLVGNGSGALINNANLYWDNTNIRLGVGKTPGTALDINGTTTSTLFSGSGASLSNLNSTNINTGTLLVNYGGTGLQSLTANAVLVGNGTGAVINNANLYWDNTNIRLGVGKTPTNAIDVSGNINVSGTFIGSGSTLSALNASNITTGTHSVATGGTGLQTLTANAVLVGNGTGAVINNANLYWDNTNIRLGVGKTPGTALDVNGTTTSTLFSGSGASLSNLNSTNINTGTLLVNYGGTGAQSLTANSVLVGNGTGTLIQPSNLIWNNTSSYLGIGTTPNYNFHLVGTSYINGTTIIGDTTNSLNTASITFNRTTTSTWAADTDITDTNRTFVVQNPSTAGTASQYSLINMQINPASTSALNRCIGDIRFVRDVTTLGYGYYLFSSIIGSTGYKDLLKIGYDTSYFKYGNVAIGKTTAGYALDVSGNVNATTFIGSASSLTNVNATNVNTGTVSVTYGGTGLSNPVATQLLVGNGTNSILQASGLTWITNTLTATNFSGNGSSITSITGSNITTGANPVAVGAGGTGSTTLTVNQLLVGNTTGALIQSSGLTWSANTLTATNIAGAGAAISSLNATNLSAGTATVTVGGTGISNPVINQLLVGNGSNALIQSAGLTWISNTLSATNIVGSGTGITALNGSNVNSGIVPVTYGGSGLSNPTVNQLLVGNGSNTILQSSGLTWSASTLTATNFSGNGANITSLTGSNITTGANPVAAGAGGTGLTSITANSLLIGNGTGAVVTNANLSWTSGTNTLNATNISGSHTGNGASLTSLTGSNITTGANPVAAGAGGTGATSLTVGAVLVGNGTNPLIQPGALTWNNTSGYLGIGKTPANQLDVSGNINSTTFSGNGAAISNINSSNISSGIASVTYGGTGLTNPVATQLLVGNGANAVLQASGLIWSSNTLTATNIAGSGTAISAINGTNVTVGIVSSTYGGTGLTNPIATQLLVGNGANAILQASGLTWSSNTFTATNIAGSGTAISAINASNVTVGTHPVSTGGIGIINPIATQLLVGNGTNPVLQSANLTWASNILTATQFSGSGTTLTTLNSSNITQGTLLVNYGGTGLQTLTANAVLVGNGTGALINNANLYWDNTNIRLGIGKTPTTALDVNGTTTSTLFSGSGASLSALNSTNINTGTLLVNYGGTGLQTLTANAVLVGNGTGAVINNANLYWNNTNVQLGIGKTPSYPLDVSGNVNISGLFIGAGSTITSINASNVNSGVASVTYGGSGLSNPAATQLLVGNGSSAIQQSANLTWTNATNTLNVTNISAALVNLTGSITLANNISLNINNAAGSSQSIVTVDNSNIAKFQGAGNLLYIGNNSTTTGINIAYNSTIPTNMYSGTTPYLQLYANGVVNVGNNTVSNKILIVNDQSSADAPTSATNFYGLGYNTSTLRFQVPSTTSYFMWYSGTIPQMQMLNGSITVTGDLSAFGSVSDSRFKENPVPILNSLNNILNLKPVKFKWKEDLFNQEKAGTYDIGLIAQEVEKIIPFVVGEFIIPGNDAIKYKKIKYEKLSVYLIGAVQELNIQKDIKIKQLENEIQDLKDQIKAIKEFINMPSHI